jgi:hypothetical protein
MKFIFLLALAASCFGAESLVSNFTFALCPGAFPGQLWVLARGDVSNGLTRVYVTGSGANLQVASFESVLFPKDVFGVQDEVFSSVTGEHRRSLLLRDGTTLLVQAFGLDENNASILPQGYIRVQGADAVEFPVSAAGLGVDAAAAWPTPLTVSMADVAFDRGGLVWCARGPWGLSLSPARATEWSDVAIGEGSAALLLNPKKALWDTLSEGDEVDTLSHLSIWALALDSVSGTFWAGSEKGLWKGNRDSSSVHKLKLGVSDSLRITGIWRSAAGQIFVESGVRSIVKGKSGSNTKTISSLWRSVDDGKTFTAVNLPYDSLDISVSSVAFLGDDAWLAVQGIENNWSGLLRINSKGPVAWADSLRLPDREDASNWIWGLDARVIDRDAFITGVSTFPLVSGMGLAVSTYGAGISVSADSGKTWRAILNQTPVKGGLAEVRTVPSVMRYGSGSAINYRLDQQSKVTIEVFGYEMRKVRTVVRNATRAADPIRSSNAREDYWDGRDDAGNYVTVGMYYVRVRDNHGHEAWGKAMWLGAAQ